MNTNDNYNIKVDVKTTYMEEHSDPEDNNYAFAYHITISNTGTIAAKLLSRHWVITDADNNVEEVRGAGVVGEQPYLEPGSSFQYTSGSVLKTPVGTMEGSYQMIAEDQKRFDAQIPVFLLSVPGILH
jgi:ApaG protein